MPYSGRCWAGTHFGRPCWSVHGSGRVCPGSCGSRSRCALISIVEPLGALTLFGGTRFTADGARNIFGAARDVWATALRPDPPKKALYHTRPVDETYDKYRLPSRSHTCNDHAHVRSVFVIFNFQVLTGTQALPWPYFYFAFLLSFSQFIHSISASLLPR